MSRVYKVELSQRRECKVDGKDEVDGRIELLDVLPAERTWGLLRGELHRRGFAEEPCGSMTKTQDVVTVEVHPDRVVRIGVTAETVEEIRLELHGAYDEDFSTEAAELSRLVDAADKKFAEEVARRQAEAQARATALLEAALPTINQQLREIENAVTRESLKLKAAQLGEVQEIRENPETGELVIRVRV